MTPATFEEDQDKRFFDKMKIFKIITMIQSKHPLWYYAQSGPLSKSGRCTRGHLNHENTPWLQDYLDLV